MSQRTTWPSSIPAWESEIRRSHGWERLTKSVQAHSCTSKWSPCSTPFAQTGDLQTCCGGWGCHHRLINSQPPLRVGALIQLSHHAPSRNEVQILRQWQLDRHLEETLRHWMGDHFAVPGEEATAPLLTVLETPRRSIAHS